MWYNEIFNCISLNLGNSKPTNKKLAAFKNNAEFQNAFARLTYKALARYDFEGLPDTVNERVLKMALLYHGSVCFFEKEGNLLALPAMPDSSLTLYGDFKSCFVYGRNGYNQKVNLYIHGGADSKLVDKGYPSTGNKTPSGVWVRENEYAYPFLNFCIAYAEKIADTMRTLDVSRKNIKTPYIISAEEQIINSVKRYFENRDNNEEYIISSGVFPADKIALLPIETTAENLKACTDLIEWYMNDFDSLCGKNSNANQDKKERLLVDEVNANNETTESNIDAILRYMQQGLDDVNEHFGVNITVIKKEEDDDDDLSGMDSDSERDEVGGSGRGNDSVD